MSKNNFTRKIKKTKTYLSVHFWQRWDFAEDDPNYGRKCSIREYSDYSSAFTNIFCNITQCMINRGYTWHRSAMTEINSSTTCIKPAYKIARNIRVLIGDVINSDKGIWMWEYERKNNGDYFAIIEYKYEPCAYYGSESDTDSNDEEKCFDRNEKEFIRKAKYTNILNESVDIADIISK